MNRAHSLRFDTLEARELLSGVRAARTHAAGAHAAPASVGAPLVLAGTLTADQHAATTTMNMDGGYTSSVPVSGQLSGLGQVHGVWSESTDVYGQYLGPDTVTLHGSQGSFTMAFSNATPGPAHRTGPHSVYYRHAQRLSGGTGAYARAKESGTIDLNLNASHSTVESLTLISKGA
jgi:hypothetical protein